MVVAVDEADDEGDEGGDSQDDEDHEPDGADDDIVGFGGDVAVIINSLFDVDDAEAGEVLDVAVDALGSIGKNKLGVTTVVSVGGKIGLAGEVVLGADNNDGLVMDVAVVINTGGSDDGGGGRKAGEGILEDVAFADGLAGDFGVDNTRHFEDVLDFDAGLLFVAVVLGDDDGGILGTGGSVLRDGDGEVDIHGVVWLQGAGGVVDLDPVGDHGAIVAFGKAGGVVLAKDGVGGNAGFESEVTGGVGRVGDADRAFVNLPGFEGDFLGHRGD